MVFSQIEVWPYYLYKIMSNVRTKQCSTHYVHFSKLDIERLANKDTWVMEPTQSIEKIAKVE